MSDIDRLRAEWDRMANMKRPDMGKLTALTKRIEEGAGREQRMKEITSVVGPARTHALVAADTGVKRVPVTRIQHSCPAVDPGSAFRKVTLEFVGDSKRSEPCPRCSKCVWRD